MYQKSYHQDQSIIKYGDIGDKYYILSSGAVQVKVYEPGTCPNAHDLEQKLTIQKQLVAEQNQMIGFGEIALLMNDKRTASIVA